LIHDGREGIREKEEYRGHRLTAAELLYTLMKNGTEYEVRKFVGGKETGAGETLAKQALAG
jgi:hypothetical protein